MNGLDSMFDFNRDGQLEAWEQGAEFQFLDEMTRKKNDDTEDDNQESEEESDY